MYLLQPPGSEEEIRALEAVLFSDLPVYSSVIQRWLFNLHAHASDFSSLSKLCLNAGLNKGYTSYGQVCTMCSLFHVHFLLLFPEEN